MRHLRCRRTAPPQSHKYHGVRPVLRGSRQVLVVELWERPHCADPERCCGGLDRCGMGPDGTPALRRLAAALQQQRKVEGVMSTHEQCAADLKDSGAHGDAHPLHAAVVGRLAGLLQAEGQLDEAAALFQQAIAASDGMEGGAHADRCAAASALPRPCLDA